MENISQKVFKFLTNQGYKKTNAKAYISKETGIDRAAINNHLNNRRLSSPRKYLYENFYQRLLLEKENKRLKEIINNYQ